MRGVPEKFHADFFSTVIPLIDLSRGDWNKSGSRTCYMKLAKESLILVNCRRVSLLLFDYIWLNCS